MAQHSSDHGHTATVEHMHHAIGPRKYVQIGLILLLVTVVEVAASFLTNVGVPYWAEVAVLLVLSIIKGSLVVLFYMHLRYDSRWFSSLFLGGLGLAAFMITTLILLFSYHANVAG